MLSTLLEIRSQFHQVIVHREKGNRKLSPIFCHSLVDYGNFFVGRKECAMPLLWSSDVLGGGFTDLFEPAGMLLL
jgi:hypothetical protein